jgi:hypothetical protein
MALKPFEFFRKRTKLFMAILVFVAMFSFIIADALGNRQGFGAQFAARIRGWFGHVENQVAEVGGQGYDSARLFELHRRRQAAMGLVNLAYRAGKERMMKDAGFTNEEMKDQRRSQERAEKLRKENPEAFAALQAQPNTLSLDALQAGEQERMRKLMGAFSRGSQAEDELPTPVTELLDYAHWLKRADQLGIVMSVDRVRDDLIRTASSKIKEDDISGLVGTVCKELHITADSDTMLNWLGDEIRVMMAKGMMLAPESDPLGGRSFRPQTLRSTQATPLDLWEAYVKVKTQLTVGVLPIRVDDKEFLSRVEVPAKGSAGWKEFVDGKLKPFFEQYKDKEPDPSRDTPGFKIPRKYQVEFVYGDLGVGIGGKTEARKFYEQSTAAQDALALAGDALGLSPLPLPVAQPWRAHGLYQLNRDFQRYRLTEDPASALMGGMQLADGSRYQLPLRAGPQPFKSTADVQRYVASQGLLDVATALNQSPAGLFSMTAAVRPMPRKVTRTIPQPQVLETAAMAVSQGLNLGMPEFSPALLGFAARADYKGEHSPFTEVAPQIFDEIAEEEARKLLSRDLRALEKALAEYGKIYRTEFDKWKRIKANAESRKLKPPEFNVPLFTHKEGEKEIKEPIKDYVARFAKVRGLEFKGMAELRSEQNLFEEKGATPLGSILKPMYVRSLPSSTRKPEDEIKAALAGRDRFGRGTPKVLFEATEVRSPSGDLSPASRPWEFALHWKIAESEPRVPTFEEAEQAVTDAWKLKEARTFAAEHADKLAGKVKTDDGERLLKDLPGYFPEKYLSRYESIGPFNYNRMSLGYMDDPPADLVDQALAKLKQKNDTLIVANEPKTIWYLFVLKNRAEPKATNGADVAMFDTEVIIPEPQRQLKVEGTALSEWVIAERARELQKNWDAWFRDRSKYDKQNAERALETLRSASR